MLLSVLTILNLEIKVNGLRGLKNKLFKVLIKLFYFYLQSKLNLISLLLRYYSNETGPRDPDSEENGQKKKGEKISESKSTAQEGYL